MDPAVRRDALRPARHRRRRHPVRSPWLAILRFPAPQTRRALLLVAAPGTPRWIRAKNGSTEFPGQRCPNTYLRPWTLKDFYEAILDAVPRYDDLKRCIRFDLEENADRFVRQLVPYPDQI